MIQSREMPTFVLSRLIMWYVHFAAGFWLIGQMLNAAAVLEQVLTQAYYYSAPRLQERTALGLIMVNFGGVLHLCGFLRPANSELSMFSAYSVP